jgi:ADP-L-glycero-D-manno-heptose 6-epimerase
VKKLAWVTGAAGFIGFRLAERLTQDGWSVVAIDHLAHFRERTEHPTKIQASWQLKERETFLREAEALANTSRPDAIFHLGACADTMNLDAEYHRRMNVEYSQALWKVATEHQIPFLYASSAAVYGEGEHGYSDEHELTQKLRPLNPYGESKRQFDVWALEQSQAGRCPSHWSGYRFFNVYGFGEKHKGRMASVVLHAFEQVHATGKVRLFKSHRAGIADGEQKRDFLAVEVLIDVLLHGLNAPVPNGIYNLGTGRAQTFLDLARAVFQAMGRTEQIEFIDTPVALRERYQYFTQAEMGKLRRAGYSWPFLTLHQAVPLYLKRWKLDA